MRELETKAAKNAARAKLADEKLGHLQSVTEKRIAQLEAQVNVFSLNGKSGTIHSSIHVIPNPATINVHSMDT